MSYSHKEIVEYLIELKNNNTPVTLHQFVIDKKEYIIKNTSLTDSRDIIEVWTTRFGRATKEVKVTMKQDRKKVDWSPILKGVLEKITHQAANVGDNNKTSGGDNNNDHSVLQIASQSQIPITSNAAISNPSSSQALGSSNPSSSRPSSNSNSQLSSSPSSSSSAASKTNSHLLDPPARALFLSKSLSFCSQKKWKLSSGRYVEDLVLKFGEELTHEHAAHSYIMCLDDSCWENVFSESELQEIIDEESRPLPSITKNIQDILDRFQQAADLICENNKYETDDQKLNGLMLNAMVDELLKIGLFDPRTHFEESWVISTINQLLSYYVNDSIAVMGNNFSELDLVTKFWCYFDRCFDDLRINTTRDRACMATTLRVNEERKVTGTDEIDNKKKSIRPDLLLVKDDVEYGCSEVGRSDNVIPTKKEIIETALHCPKTMKDILNRVASLVDYDEKIIQKLQFVCFHQTNRRMKLSLIDCPRGYICRVMESDEYEIPVQAKLFPAQVLPLIKLMLQAKGIVSETMQLLTRYQMSKKGEVGLRRQNQKEKKASTVVLPSSLNFTSNNLKRKRKIQD